ncbi:fibro-slime domain-containing protein [Bifidobacterium sp. CP2]|uniref:fibro-slime domain-containing protein n=1 Tax=Bifidobacterium TaxID=1678 RepID=UPI001BDBE761|nr:MULTISPECIES: fibro-slime domain-containing protein [Bifidobacterium]MBT1181557.1 fibro-slime domain-containing protein [Bifidobacterium sp. CP2]MBW3081076.1 fibro-slime domain-containing protein [Bifidobacterium saguinibicoloris]
MASQEKNHMARVIRAAICATAASATLMAVGIAPASATPSSASVDEGKTLTLPVQFIDYDKDNLLFEYAMGAGTGADDLSLNNGKNDTARTGLVADTLGKNGMPQYDKAAVEQIAKGIDTELGRADASDIPSDPAQRTMFQRLLAQFMTKAATKSTVLNPADPGDGVAGAFGKWSCGDGSAIVDDTCMTPAADGTAPSVTTLWEQNGNGVYGYSKASTLTSGAFTVTPNTEYKFSVWADNGGTTAADMNVAIRNGKSDAITAYNAAPSDAARTTRDSVAKDAGAWQDFYFNSGDAKAITIALTPAADAKTVRIAGAQLVPAGANNAYDAADAAYTGMLGDGTHYFYAGNPDAADNTKFGKWTVSGTGKDTEYAEGKASKVTGTMMWSQDGDSVLSMAGTAVKPLTRTITGLTPGETYTVSYARGFVQAAYAGIKATDAAGTTIPLTVPETDANKGANTVDQIDPVAKNDTGEISSFDLTVPKDSNGAVTLFILAGKDKDLHYRAGNITIKPKHNTLKSQTYAEAVASVDLKKKIDLSSDSTDNGIGVFQSPMAYAYYMLNNLFTGNAGTPYFGYDKMVLAYDGSKSAHGHQIDKYTFAANTSVEGDVTYQPGTKDAPGSVAYDPTATKSETDGNFGFFPLDGIDGGEMTEGNIGIRDENGKPVVKDGRNVYVRKQHNYHYAMKSNGVFTYHQGAGQFFDFTGDDDVYLFVNNKLAIDLGGAHTAASKDVDLDAQAKSLGLQDGKTYRFDFFYMERHTDEADIKVTTNLDVTALSSDYTLLVSNVLNGKAMNDGDYQFTVKPADTDAQGNAIPEADRTAAATMLGLDAADIDTGRTYDSPKSESGRAVNLAEPLTLKFTPENAGTYVYNIAESHVPGDAAAGYTNDSAPRKVVITVTKDDTSDTGFTVTTTVDGKELESENGVPPIISFVNSWKAPSVKPGEPNKPTNPATPKHDDGAVAGQPKHELARTGASVLVAVVACMLLAGAGILALATRRHD